jgi:hypothetical protein
MVPVSPPPVKIQSVMVESTHKGRGSLYIRNGSRLDAMVCLWDGRVNGRAIVILAGERGTLRSIPSGSYVVSVAQGRRTTRGSDWQFEAREHFKLTDVFKFTEETTKDGTRFHDFSIALQPGIVGNARTEAIGSNDFDLNGIFTLEHAPVERYRKLDGALVGIDLDNSKRLLWFPHSFTDGSRAPRP